LLVVASWEIGWFLAGRVLMEEIVKECIGYVALGTEVGAAILIAYGALEAFVLALRIAVLRQGDQRAMRDVYLSFARWLVLALEFELASDVLRTAVSPTWADIGELGAIAVSGRS